MSMSSATSEIRKAIDELNGIQFKGMNSYSKKQIIFFEERYEKIISLLPEIDKNDKVLEIGISGGILALSVKRIFDLDKLWAIEHPDVIANFSSIYRKKLKKENILLKAYDLHSNKNIYKSDKFDLILVSEVIEHLIPAHIQNVLVNIKTLLNKNGVLFISTPNISSLLKRINLLRGKSPIEYDLSFHFGETYGHIREYTKTEISKMILNCGYKIKDSGYFNIDSDRNIFTRVEKISSLLFSQLSNNMYFVVSKK